MSEAATILVVDDTPNNIHLIRGVLSNDYAIKVATNGRMALKIAEEQHPDLILLDIMMPEMDGFEVCRRLKAAEATHDIPIIFLTAKSEIADEAAGLELGAVDYITKPISPPILQARIRNQLALQSAYRQLEQQNRELIEAAKLREDVQRITQHDLKNPLNTVIGLPPMMKLESNLTDQQRQFLDMIETSGFRMLEMINRSLDLYKMEVGSYDYQPVVVDLVAVLGRVFGECATMAGIKRVELQLLKRGEAITEGEGFSIMGEELLCHTLFSNLVKNAIEASGNEGDTVTVDLCQEGGVASIRVHNRGVVPQEIRGNFFDKYATSGKVGGTGLGTYSAALSARTMGGTIELHASTEEAGTTIVVTLPSA